MSTSSLGLPGTTLTKRVRGAAGALGLAASLLAGSHGPVLGATAAPPDLAVEVLPSPLAVPATGQAEALVILRNPSPERLEHLRLSWLNHAGVEIAMDSPDFPDLEPYGSSVKTLRLSRSQEGPLEGTVHLRVDYTWPREGGKAAPRVSVTPLKVAPLEPDTVEQVASLEVKTTASSLVEYRPGRMYLVLTNTSKGPIDLLSVSTRAPGFVGLTPEEPIQRKGLLPRDVYVIPFKVEAKDSIQPGKHLLLFHAHLQWRRGGRALSGSLVTTQETEVGILGESEILTALGVPTFLVLPGFLMLVTFGLLWRRFPAESLPKERTFPIEAKSAEFWLIAITLSIFMALLYPALSGMLGDRRSYLEGYGLGDVIWVWTISIAAAALVFFVLVARANAKADQQRKLTLSRKDGPIELLRKLGRQGLKAHLPQANVEIEGQEELQRAFLLQPNDGRERIWIGPPISLRWLPNADRALEERILSEADPAKLADLLEQVKDRTAKIDWKTATGEGEVSQVKAPQEIARTAIKKELGPGRLVVIAQES